MDIKQHILDRIAELEKEKIRVNQEMKSEDVEGSDSRRLGFNAENIGRTEELQNLLKHLEQEEQIVDAEEAALSYRMKVGGEDESHTERDFIAGWNARGL